MLDDILILGPPVLSVAISIVTILIILVVADKKKFKVGAARMFLRKNLVRHSLMLVFVGLIFNIVWQIAFITHTQDLLLQRVLSNLLFLFIFLGLFFLYRSMS